MIWPEMVVQEARRRLEAAKWPQMVGECFQIARNSTKPKKYKKQQKTTKNNLSSAKHVFVAFWLSAANHFAAICGEHSPRSSHTILVLSP